MSSKDVVLAYCTFPNPELAEQVSELLVRESIIACANILGPITSIYNWNGTLAKERETAVIFKTTALKQSALKERIRAVHPYAVPALVFVPVVDGLPDFLKWIYTQSL